ncbi:Calcium-activated potassium channel slo-1 [Taenia solium]|eukprot:TsM_000610400 transcript=TsM_000610400 gene=TsM_000610400
MNYSIHLNFSQGLRPTPLGCLEDRLWYTFIIASLTVLTAGFATVLLMRLILWIFCKIQLPQCERRRETWRGRRAKTRTLARRLSIGAIGTQLKECLGDSLSGQRISGRVIHIVVFTLNAAAFIIYSLDANQLHYERGRQGLEICVPIYADPFQKVDFFFNVIFLCYFIIRFIVSDDRLLFWFELYSLVDIFTIPPAFLSLYLRRNWLGLRFVRCLSILSLTDVLQYLNIIKSSTAIRLSHLFTFFAGFVISAAGFIHLVENSGDPPTYLNQQNLTYFECLYLTIVTMTTVGYGDLTCQTTMGRAFMVVFILGALAVFANAVPEIADILDSRTKYGGTYVTRLGKPHLILCGHITFTSVKNFLSDFLHKDRENVVTQIVILDQKAPNLEMEGLLKRYENQVHYFQGSVMVTRDLTRVGLDNADACLVLANKYSNDPDAEDATNIMRVISIKNSCANIKVIVQLMQYHNKTYLLNIPNWDWRRGDDAICVAELKLGFLAQNCLAPGFSTLLANLFTMRTYRKSESQDVSWLNDYMEGAGMEMYTEQFSPSFEKMTFAAAAELCFSRLRLLLIAVQCKGSLETHIFINPNSSTKITANTQGFFIAQSAEEAKRAALYCKRCHANVEMHQVKLCPCVKSGQMNRTKSIFSRLLESASVIEPALPVAVGTTANCLSPLIASTSASSSHLDLTWLARGGGTGISNHLSWHGSTLHHLGGASADGYKPSGDQSTNTTCQFDATGMFHWCPERSIKTCLLDDEQPASKKNFTDHIVVCIFADYRSPIIGLRSFIMPLRASNLHIHDLKTVVLVGNLEYIKREWKTLANFPRIWVLPGSPLSKANLRSVNVNLASMCVILSSKSDNTIEDLTLADKEAILCSLNVKAMDFSDLDAIYTEPTCTTIKHLTLRRDDNVNSFKRPSRNRVQNLILNKSHHQSGATQSVDPNIPAVFYRPPRFISRNGATIPMATELAFDMNVQFLDQEDDDEGGELFMTQPFACGTAFTISVLDSLMSTAYFNESALTLIRSLVTGGSTPLLEKILAEGAGMRGGSATSTSRACKERCRLAQLTLTGNTLGKFAVQGTPFEKLFLAALREYGILIIGIYRLLRWCDLGEDSPVCHRRFVITNPPPSLPLHPTDWIFCLVPHQHILEPSQVHRV